MNIGKYIFVVLMLFTTAFFSSYAIAHPPQDMVLQYDIETEILSLTITHNTPAQNIHYIYKIEIRRNDQIVVTELYESQPTTSEFTYTYNVQALVGDELAVTAYCNIQGSITRSIIVRDPSQDEPPVVEIVNPTEGYFHFSGIRLFPASGIIANTMGFGGFRLRPLQIYTEDDVDNSVDLNVKVFINEKELGTAEYNVDNELHEIKWTGPNLGIFTLSVTAEDSIGNIGEDQMQVWYFCFIP